MLTNTCQPQVGCENIYDDQRITLIYPTDNESFRKSPFILTLENIRLRFRTVHYYHLFENYPFIPMIVIMPPSEYDCNDSSFRCETDQVCYDDYLSYCYHCLALTEKECGCRDVEGVFADGTWCDYPAGLDVVTSGQCQDGVCIDGARE